MIKKNNLIAMNLVCLLLISLLCVFAWSQLKASTANFDNDYKTFYETLHRSDQPYRITQYVRVLSISKSINGKAQVRVTPQMSALNMNSPTMNMFLKGLVNIANTLSSNVMIYVLASLWCAGLSLFILSRLFPEANLNFYFLPILLLFMLTWPALYTLKLGQVAFFILPFLSLAVLFLWNRQWSLMALLFGLVAALKLFFLIFILYFVLRKQLRLAILFVISFLFFFFLPLLYFSWVDYLRFFQMAHNFNDFVVRASLPMNASLLSLLSNLSIFFQLKTNLIGMQVAFYLLALYCVVRSMIYDRRFLQSLPEYTELFSLSFLIMLALFVSPLAWVYYFVFLIIPFVLFFKVSQNYELPREFFTYFIAALIFPCFAWIVVKPTLMQFLLHVAGFISLIFWGICLHMAAKAVASGNRLPQSSHRKLLFICAGYAIFNIFLLSVGFGMPYFFDLNQQNYLSHAAPAIIVKLH